MAIHTQWQCADSLTELIENTEDTGLFTYLAYDFVDGAEAWQWVVKRGFGHGHCIYIHSHNDMTVRVFHNPGRKYQQWAVIVFRFTYGEEGGE